jgi:thioredoxin-related protein
MMDKEVLYTSEVKKLCEQLNCVKVDGARSNEGISLARNFHIPGFPATLIVDSRGTLIEQINGYVPLQYYTAKINFVIEENKKFEKALVTITTDKENLEALASLLEGYYNRHDFDESLKYADIIIKLDPDGKKGFADTAYYVKSLVLIMGYSDEQGSLKHLEILLKNWPESKRVKNSLYLKGLLLLRVNREEEGKKTLLEIKERFPDDKELIRKIENILKRLK